MRRTLVNILVFSIWPAMLAFELVVVLAQQSGGTCHVLLLDVSGSMKVRYANNLKTWLMEPLLRSRAFAPSDRVLVRWFDQRGSATFTRDDPQRRYYDRHDLKKVLSQVPSPREAVGLNTDLPEALELVLADIKTLPIEGDVMVWLVTDNDQDYNGVRDANQLYLSISNEKNFRAAYLFPLVTENGRALQPADSALVLYLLYYSPKSNPPSLDRFADEIGKVINNPAVTWFPFEKAISLDESSITANSEPVKIVDNKLVLPDVAEGVHPEFEIQFRFRSALRGREIRGGKISRPMASVVQLPEAIEAEGDLGLWQAAISPTSLAIKSNQNSSMTYLASVASAGAVLHPAGFWEGVWNSTSHPVEVVLQFTPTDIETTLDVAALTRVKNLGNVQQIVQRSQEANKPIAIPMTFQVRYDTVWRRAIAAIAGLLGLLGVAGGAALFAGKSKYELSTPQGERVLSMGALGKEYIGIDGERAAVVSKRFGRLIISPLSGYAMDGGKPFRWPMDHTNDFAIESKQDGRRYSYSIKRLAKGGGNPIARDTILD
jgi:hypothetical protein